MSDTGRQSDTVRQSAQGETTVRRHTGLSEHQDTETRHQSMRMGDNTNNNTQSIADYLAQLLKDKKQLAAFPNVFIHMERLLDDGE